MQFFASQDEGGIPISKTDDLPLGPPQPPSDVRLKTDISEVGTTVHGLPLYQFRYLDGTGPFEGVMAQDVLKVRPDAVLTGEDGFYRVDYARLGITMKRV